MVVEKQSASSMRVVAAQGADSGAVEVEFWGKNLDAEWETWGEIINAFYAEAGMTESASLKGQLTSPSWRMDL
jgi:hypothetical protein